MPLLKFVHKIGYCKRSKWLLSSALLARSEGTSCEAFIMFNVSFIINVFFIINVSFGTCVKRDSMSKLTSRSVGYSQIF